MIPLPSPQPSSAPRRARGSENLHDDCGVLRYLSSPASFLKFGSPCGIGGSCHVPVPTGRISRSTVTSTRYGRLALIAVSSTPSKSPARSTRAARFPQLHHPVVMHADVGREYRILRNDVLQDLHQPRGAQRRLVGFGKRLLVVVSDFLAVAQHCGFRHFATLISPHLPSAGILFARTACPIACNSYGRRFARAG